MGNETPTPVIRSAITNELGLFKATAHSTMDESLAIAVMNNKTTPERRAYLLKVVESVARGERLKMTSQDVVLLTT